MPEGRKPRLPRFVDSLRSGRASLGHRGSRPSHNSAGRFLPALRLGHDSPMPDRQRVLLPYDASRLALYQPQQRDTLFVPGMAPGRLLLGAEAARLAYIRCENGPAERARLDAALAAIGFGAATCFHEAGMSAQGFGAYRDDDGLALVAFRGTEADDLSDLATDLNARPVDWIESAGRVHAGFARATRALRPAVEDFLATTAARRRGLLLCGHSLGGAMATLAASLWAPAELVTLGSPRVGDERFAATVVAAGSRLVNCCDLVTELPPKLNTYTHVQPPTYIDAEGFLTPTATPEFIGADRGRARRDYLSKHAWRPNSVLVRDLADHAPINYIRALL